MKCILTNFGTTGDLQPFLALATELCRRGHFPVLAFPRCMERRVRDFGFEFIALGPDSAHIPQEINRILLTDTQASTSCERAADLLRPLFEALPESVSRLQEICRDADLLISGPAQPGARMVHELTGIAWVSVQLSHFGGGGMPGLRQASAELINPLRRTYGLPALSDPLTHDANSPLLSLYAVSQHLRALPQDWPAYYKITGFFYLEEAAPGPQENLRKFVEAGEPPIVVTFGSMGNSVPQEFMEMILEALIYKGWRVVIQHNSDICMSEKCNSENVFVAGFVPHLWLFPKAACIVHHGGAGTAAAVFRSGVPSVFVPHGHAYDQTYWAHLAQDYGCSGSPLPFHELDASKLVCAISDNLCDPRLRTAAVELSKKISREEGVRCAVRWIEKMASDQGCGEDELDSAGPRVTAADI